MVMIYGIKLDGVSTKYSPAYKKGRSKKKYHAYRRLRQVGFTPSALSWLRGK